jgi:hypothetical protein
LHDLSEDMWKGGDKAMKRIVTLSVVIALLALAAVALAFTGGPPGWAGRGGMMGGFGMGLGMMMGAGGPGACPFAAGAGTTAITEEKAKDLAAAYAEKYLKGFTVDKVLPVNGPAHTMYVVELVGPNEEVRVLHINPFGTVMPMGGPWRRGV